MSRKTVGHTARAWLAWAFVALMATSGMAGAHDFAGDIGKVEQETGKLFTYSTHDVTGKLRMLQVDRERQKGATGEERAAASVVRKGAPAASNEQTARRFLDSYGHLFGVARQAEELHVKRHKATGDGRDFIRFQQKRQGLPVIGGELIVQLGNDGEVASINGRLSPDASIDTTPAISGETAREKALELVAKRYRIRRSILTTTNPELSVYNPALVGHRENGNLLVWQTEVSSTNREGQPVREYVLIDAHTGFPTLNFSKIYHTLNRAIYDANETTSPVTLVRSEGSPASNIPDADTLYTNLGITYDYYSAVFGRDSYDNNGAAISAAVHYCSDPSHPASSSFCENNSFWDGNQQMLFFGDGNPAALDVVGHEFTHAVTEKEANLFYYMQSGAINESMSDVFGKFIQLINFGDSIPSSERWLIDVNGPEGAIRSMKDPKISFLGINPSPDRMGSSNYKCGLSDSGGVHYNSGVNNKAAYLMTDGDTFNGKTITGIGIEKTERIYYEALTNLLTSGSDYADLYDALQLACSNLTGTAGISTSDCQQVKSALDAVEMNKQPATCQAPEAQFCPAGGKPVDLFFEDFESPDTTGNYANWATGMLSGSNVWNPPADTYYSHNGTFSIWGEDLDYITDSSIAMKTGVTLPADAYLHFWHAYDFDYYSSAAYDGGVVEYSSDNGATWSDAGSLFGANGYNGTISATYDNPLKGRPAFVKLSNGYISSRASLASLAGKQIRFRFRLATDSSYGGGGWNIDDVRIYTCDTHRPQISTFTLPPASASLTVDGIVLTATDTDGVTGYLLTESSTQPLISDNGWSSTAPDSYTFASAGVKTLYAWARNGAGNVSAYKSAQVTIDMTAPTVTLFSVTTPSSTLKAAVTAFAASDNVAVKGYLITENDALPLASDTGWSTAKPTGYTFATAGDKTLHAWVKDAAGNVSGISDVATATVNLVLPAPVVTAFSLPGSVNGPADIPVTTFEAVDNGDRTITGYLITTTSTAPTAGLSDTKPARYSFPAETSGIKTLYAWAQDDLGRVSKARTTTVNIDTKAPSVTSFTLKSPVNTLTIPVTAFTASDNTGVTGYLITENDAVPALEATWETTRPASYTDATPGVKTLYAWARDGAGNISAPRMAMATIDMAKPQVNAFNVPLLVKSRTVPVTTFNATDDLKVAGYLITENDTVPALNATWKTTKPVSYTAATPGAKTLYAWVKDTAGNISDAVTAPVNIDLTRPVVDTFSVNSPATSLDVEVTGINATDNTGVTGYLVTASSTPPLASAAGWNVAKPTGYTFTTIGTKTLYAWAKDGAGNVSTAKTAKVVIPATAVATISGRVTNGSGAGLALVTVSVYNATTNALAKSVKTSTNGIYTVSGLDSRDYKVFFDGSSRGYDRKFFGGEFGAIDTATTVTVNAPTALTGIDATLTAGGWIKGRVTRGGASSGIAGIQVYPYRADGTLLWGAERKTDAYGYYTLTGLPAGDYKLRFDGGANWADSYYSNQLDLGSGGTVTVSTGTVTGNVNAALIPR